MNMSIEELKCKRFNFRHQAIGLTGSDRLCRPKTRLRPMPDPAKWPITDMVDIAHEPITHEFVILVLTEFRENIDGTTHYWWQYIEETQT